MDAEGCAREVTAAILAGGAGSRMGYVNKALVHFRGKPLVEHVIHRISAQVSETIIVANHDLQSFRDYDARVLADNLGGGNGALLGPLAGFEAGLSACSTPYLITVACDTPFFPDNLVARLYCSLTEHDCEIAVAHDGERMHPVFCLIKKATLTSLRGFLSAGGRKIDRWFANLQWTTTVFSSQQIAFSNINTKGELQALEASVHAVSDS